MNELIKSYGLSERKGEPVVSSRKVAEIFGKEHDKVLRDIEDYISSVYENIMETLSKIADALEISLSDLLGQTIPKEEQTMNEQVKTTDQEMKECFRQLFFKLSEASESSDCTANELMTITQAMLSIYPMFRTFPNLLKATPDVDVIANELGKQIREQVTAVNSAAHTV